MIVRDGRNVEHDLGPRRFYGTIISLLARDPMFRPMPEGGSWRDESSRTWLRSSCVAITPEQRLANRRASEKVARLANLDAYRASERIRQQRRRDRQKASTAA